MSSSVQFPKEWQAAGGGPSMDSPTSSAPDAIGSGVVSIALIGPNAQRRESIAAALASLDGSATREFFSYPELDDVPRLLEAEFDVIIVELDSNPEYALELVENSILIPPLTAHWKARVTRIEARKIRKRSLGR